MKNIVLLFSMVLFATAVHAQGEGHSNPAGSEKYFIVHYTPGSAWKKDKPANEQVNFKEHSEHLSDLRKRSKIDIGGRYGNTMMLLVRAKSEGEAKSLVEDDPAVKNKLFNTELAPFTPFFNGCVR
jgi:hypothetical protein